MVIELLAIQSPLVRAIGTLEAGGKKIDAASNYTKPPTSGEFARYSPILVNYSYSGIPIAVRVTRTSCFKSLMKMVSRVSSFMSLILWL